MAKIGDILACALCGSDFQKLHARQRFCCPQCMNASTNAKRRERTNVAHTCPTCGEPFYRKSRRQFCSDNCRDVFYWSQPDNVRRKNATHRLYMTRHPGLNHYYWHKWYTKQKTAQPWASLLVAAKNRAQKKALAFDLDYEWASESWTGRCSVTNLPFLVPEQRKGHQNRSFFPTIDRIDNSVGYTKVNCRFVLWAVNALKGDGTNDDMVKIATALMEQHSSL